MKRVIVLASGAVLALLMLVGCAATEESAPVGATVRLLGADGSYINLYHGRISTDPLNPDLLMVPAGTECEVLSGPRVVEGATYWEIDCSWSDVVDTEGYGLRGWVDVTDFEVLE